MNEDIFKLFLNWLKEINDTQPAIMKMMLENIFSMRVIGNKTHGDMAEIGITSFVNKFSLDFIAKHTGKDNFRAKANEEDVLLTHIKSNNTESISMKAYGDGPLQLSTDKENLLFPMLTGKQFSILEDINEIKNILSHDMFNITDKNIIPLIYDEKNAKCCIMIFDFEKAKNNVAKIELLSADECDIVRKGKKRKHEVFRFYDINNNYLFEVRYGNAASNGLQRGLWTHTKNANQYFDNITGWIKYSPNRDIIKLFAIALVSDFSAHKRACEELEKLF